MGSELILPLGFISGALLFGLLCYLSCNRTARPFAIPTLVASLVWAWNAMPSSAKPYSMAGFFALEFATGATIFGLHAIFIKVALELKGIASNQAPASEAANGSGRSDGDA